MTEVFQLCPAPPDFELDWGAVNDAFAWVRAMRGCPQDAVHHAEGDVWVHTRMVCESLAASAAWRGLPEGERAVVFAAALMHDIGKPACTREEGGRVTSRGHSPRGAILARESLWRMDAPVRAREQVAALVRWHQVPFFLLEREDGRRRLFEVSQTARADLLALVAEADARGRVGEGQGRLVDNVALFAGYAEEEGCLSGPKQFPSDHSRFLYFRKADRDPDYHAFDDTVCEVIVMSGLPGAGKDH
jgi:putative nucleotidyltransferase with HDIG domain